MAIIETTWASDTEKCALSRAHGTRTRKKNLTAEQNENDGNLRFVAFELFDSDAKAKGQIMFILIFHNKASYLCQGICCRKTRKLKGITQA